MSFYGGSSSVGGGGFRFNAPSAATTSTEFQLSTAPGMPPVTIQTLLKSDNPSLLLISQQVSSCKAKAATMSKGSDAQKLFNDQYISLVESVSTVIHVIEQVMSRQITNQIADGDKIDHGKVPSSVSVHSVAKDLAGYIASKVVSAPYLELISKSVIASIVEKETAQEKQSAAKVKKMAKAAQAKNANPKVLSPGLHPNPLIIGGLPSPLQRPTNEQVSSAARLSDQLDALPPMALPTATPSAQGGGPQQQQQQKQAALDRLLQPWLLPYPFSHGIRTDRVQSVKTSAIRSQKQTYAVEAFRAKHPKKAGALIERIPSHLYTQEPIGSKSKVSPTIPPSGPLPPNDVILQHILAHGNLSRQQLYSLAPKILEICACPTATEMLQKWEQREAVFDVLLNAPAVGIDTLGQVSSVNNSSNAAVIGTGASSGDGPVPQTPNSNSGAHVSLAHRSGELGSYDNSQLYMGSPTLNATRTPPIRPVEQGAKRNMFEITPLVLANDDPVEEAPMAPLTLGDYGPSSASVPAVTPQGKFFPHRCSNPELRQTQAATGRGSGGFTVTNTATGRTAVPDFRQLGAPAFALSPGIAPKRPREENYQDPRSMFEMSPPTLATDSAVAIGHFSPQPAKPLDCKGVPGIRSQSRLASPVRTSAPTAQRRDADKPQAYMAVSARVMACLLHFGVVTTELPMVVGLDKKNK